MRVFLSQNTSEESQGSDDNENCHLRHVPVSPPSDSGSSACEDEGSHEQSTESELTPENENTDNLNKNSDKDRIVPLSQPESEGTEQVDCSSGSVSIGSQETDIVGSSNNVSAERNGPAAYDNNTGVNELSSTTAEDPLEQLTQGDSEYSLSNSQQSDTEYNDSQSLGYSQGSCISMAFLNNPDLPRATPSPDSLHGRGIAGFVEQTGSLQETDLAEGTQLNLGHCVGSQSSQDSEEGSFCEPSQKRQCLSTSHD